MDKTRTHYTSEKFIKMIKRGTLSFDFAIQRVQGQWDKGQTNDFIHSILQGYDIPPIYIIKEGREEIADMSILDGKQRLTQIFDFYNDKFKLNKDFHEVVIYERENGKIEQQVYNLSGLTFSQLPDELKTLFLEYELPVVLLHEYTKEQIEIQFYRLNNGSVFTKQQKANALLGNTLAEEIKKLSFHDLFEDKVALTAAQKKNGNVVACILQMLMLLEEYKYTSFSSQEVINFAKWYKNNWKQQTLDYLRELLDKLYMLSADNEKFKIMHLPSLVMNIHEWGGLDLEIGVELSEEDYMNFLSDWTSHLCEESGYLNYCGQASTSRAKVEGRINTMSQCLRKYAISLRNNTSQSSMYTGQLSA